jgi:DNA ligase (NAD+)
MNNEEYQTALKQLNIWAYEYYERDSPSVDDSIWDTLYKAVETFEDKNPTLADPLSITQFVGWVSVPERRRRVAEQEKNNVPNR